MKKFLWVVLPISLLVWLAPLALAVEETTPPAVRSREELEARRQQRLEQLFDRKEELEAQIQEKRQEREQTREEFRLRLEEIKSERKRQILLNLDEAYARINQRWTTHFSNVLDHLETILGKINLRAENDGAAVQNEIDAANRLIETAREKVAGQAAKIYTIEITEEPSLRNDAKAVHQQLRADLTALREEIKVVRQAIQNILRVMAGAAVSPQVTNTPQPEVSPTPAPTNIISQSVSVTSSDGRASAKAESIVIINNE